MVRSNGVVLVKIHEACFAFGYGTRGLERSYMLEVGNTEVGFGFKECMRNGCRSEIICVGKDV